LFKGLENARMSGVEFWPLTAYILKTQYPMEVEK
jgi:hypothetical protein